MQVNKLPGRRHRVLARLAAAAVLAITYSASAIDVPGFSTRAMADEEKKKEDASRKRMHRREAPSPQLRSLKREDSRDTTGGPDAPGGGPGMRPDPGADGSPDSKRQP